MTNEILKKILEKKEISIHDRIKFRTIFDVVSALFTDENHVSLLKGFYNINDQQQVWFPSITPDSQKELIIESGYGNYMSKDWDYIYQFDGAKSVEKRKKLSEKQIDKNAQLITFAKINEKSKGVGYHFVGVFTFSSCEDKECKTMVYRKISDTYKLIK